MERIKGIECAVIPKLKEGERLVIYVNVGHLPMHKAMEYVDGVKNNFLKGVWAENPDQYIFVSVRDDSETLPVDFKLESNA